MTRTLAAKVIDGLRNQGWEIIGHGGTWAGAMRPLEEYVKRKVERAVKAEREACAKVADRHSTCKNDTPDVIAVAIRARGKK